MGSESPPSTVLYITGFKKFQGVPQNPTEILVSNLASCAEKGGLPPCLRLGSSTILETAGDGNLGFLSNLFLSSVPPSSAPPPPSSSSSSSSSGSERVLWLHMGVNSGSTKFAIERRAINEATFRCPDELGWQPQRVPIVPEDGSLSFFRETTLPVVEMVESLSTEGHDVVVSDDAGRFVCNYVYYHSLRHASLHNTQSLFVHVPSFSKIDEGKQMQFVISLLNVLASTW